VSVLLIIDGSVSIDQESFNKIKTWINSIAYKIDYNKTTLGVGQFSKKSSTKIEIPLAEFSGPVPFITEVNKINHQLGAGTQMDAALEISIKEFDRTKDWGSEKFLVLLTDGE